MHKVGDKVLYRDSEMHNVWHEGEVVMVDGLAPDRYQVSATKHDHRAWRFAPDLKPRTSPNELTVVVNIDASAAIAELDGFGELITQRVKAAVAAGLAGETADLVRERDALREELAACRRERDATVTHLEERVNELTNTRNTALVKLGHAQSALAARDERVIELTRERDEARQKLADASAEAAGSGRACEDLRAEWEAMRVERNVLNAMLTKVRAALDIP
jgi:hypothetical protein